MTKERNDGGPAFAAMGVGPAGDVYHEAGMTRREYMATAILAGMLAGRNGKALDPGVFHIDAKWAADCTDELLLELSKS